MSDCDKSLGPDGYPLFFFCRCWSFVKDEVKAFVQEFFVHDKLPKAITASFIALVSKSKNSQSIDEFRPICFVSSLYRLIYKLLAARLKVVIGKLVVYSQMAYIEGRQMLDGVLVLNEILNFAERLRRKCLVVKNDFKKAYDCFSWGFLCYVLLRTGFGHRWMSWMNVIVFSSSMFILVNGSHSEDFIASRGLRQGDPLSLFLFLLVAKGLAGFYEKCYISWKFSGVSFQ